MDTSKPSPSPETPDHAKPGNNAATAPRPQTRRRRILRFCAILMGSLLVAGAAGIGGAEYYTAQPNFCGSCHVMDPYYESWSHDVHGDKLDVRCVDCHYAPGEKFTVMAKFKGLSQAASYFSGRYGAGRPRAHVANESCLTSACHGDGEFRSKTLPIGTTGTETRHVGADAVAVERVPTVHFVHAKHLDGVSERVAALAVSAGEISRRLRGQIGTVGFERLERATRSIAPAAEREASLKALLVELGAPAAEADALELMRLEHNRIRLAQLEDINCSACHIYDPTSANHFSVALTTCYTCHFTNQEFNRDTGECLRCHEPPTRKFVVHGSASTTTGVADPAALMDHRDIVERKIDCASCHFDVIQGEAVVTIRDCVRCHDQDRYLVDFDSRDTQTVEDYHRVHVAGQKAKCFDCHRAMDHRLIETDVEAGHGGFLDPVRNDCQHCHPNHHREQVQMLMGVGGQGVDRPMPNAMFGSRLNCRACHSESGSDFKGAPLIEATQKTCVACHSADYEKLFQQWLSEIDSSVKEATAALERVDRQVETLRAQNREPPADRLRRLEMARANLRFVSTSNGIHNKNYALQLLDLCTQELDRLMVELSENR